MKDAKTRYYVYAYLDPRKPGQFTYGELSFEFEPFYIGKGEGRRWKRHLCEVLGFQKKTWNPIKRGKIRKIVALGMKPIIIKLYDSLNENDAFTKERETVLAIGRITNKTGVLANLTDGGDGQRNYRHTPESLAKMSKSQKESYATTSRTTWNKGLRGWHTPEMLESIKIKVSQKCTGIKKSYTKAGLQNLKDSVSKRMKGSKLPEEQLAKMRVAQQIRRSNEKASGYKRKNVNNNRKGVPAWNKGLTKKDDPRIAKQGWKEEEKDRMKAMVSQFQKGKPKKPESILKAIETRKANNKKAS